MVEVSILGYRFKVFSDMNTEIQIVSILGTERDEFSNKKGEIYCTF